MCIVKHLGNKISVRYFIIALERHFDVRSCNSERKTLNQIIFYPAVTEVPDEAFSYLYPIFGRSFYRRW